MKCIQRRQLDKPLFAIAVLIGGFFSALRQVENAYYASPSGGGSGSSQSSPFNISDFWSIAKPGSTLYLLDGVYTGPNSMINPPSGLNGTSGSPIVVKALNDGGVRINGQGSNIPVLLRGNSYFIVEGVNCHNSVGTVVLVDGGSQNSIIRRVCAWDRASSNGGIISTSNSSNILFEDVAAFGRGRILFSLTQSANYATIRRAWGEYQAEAPGGPQDVYEWMYNSTNQRLENVIGTWNAPSSYNPYGVVFMGDEGTGHQMLGSIFYVLPSASYQAPQIVYQNIGKVTLRDIAVYSGQSNKKPFALGSGGSMTNVTEIGGAPSSFGSWSVTNKVTAATAAQAPSIWNGPGTQGARICKRYVNGNLTSTPLWPWPMNNRIIAAMQSAGRAPVNVTATMQSLFGPIPAECMGGGTVTTTAPSGEQAQQQQVQQVSETQAEGSSSGDGLPGGLGTALAIFAVGFLFVVLTD